MTTNNRSMKDVQNLEDFRGIEIQRVGVKDVHLPLRIAQRAGGVQSVLGNVTLSVNLPQHYRGTHMSRFLEVLMKWSEEGLTSPRMRAVLAEVREKLAAHRSDMTIRFKYFLPKRAPISGNQSFLDYDCEFTGTLDDRGFIFTLGVEVPVTTVCPCSKEISEFGAHNQRSLVRVRLRSKPGQYLWIEDVVEMVEPQGSCQIYPLLKREDEKFVTESAYQNPKFVEDVVRDTVLALRRDPRIIWFEVESESFESIHNHSAFAYFCEERR